MEHSSEKKLRFCLHTQYISHPKQSEILIYRRSSLKTLGAHLTAILKIPRRYRYVEDGLYNSTAEKKWLNLPIEEADCVSLWKVLADCFVSLAELI